MTILDALDDPQLLGAAFDGDTWNAWRAFLAACFALPMPEGQLATFRACTGRACVPEGQVREAWCVAGRRGGKSRVAAAIAVYLAAFRDYTDVLATGEVGTLPIVAADRRQARTVMGYVTGLIEDTPMLAAMVVGRTAESIELSTGVRIEIHTASWRALRGYTVVAAVCDEVAFWRSEDTANPDVEIIGALRPAMATIPGALLVAISSPYARRGILWEQFRRYHGRAGDTLVWCADTASMNPAVDPQVIAAAYDADPIAASAEYGAQFRTDVETFVSREVVDACTVPGRQGVPPVPEAAYVAFTDPSGGSSDSMTLAVAHAETARDGRVTTVLDQVTERKPPFSPEETVAEFCAILRAYGVHAVVGDRYGGQFVQEAFTKRGVAYTPSELPKSDLYRELLPALTSRRVALLDHPRLHAQLLGLERRTSRAGRDSIDHGPGGHDDLANAAAGSLVLAATACDWGDAPCAVNLAPAPEEAPIGLADTMRAEFGVAGLGRYVRE